MSGGNAQKIIVARELDAKPDLLIACQPTRGIDIGSIEFIHRQILKYRNAGNAVILISSELSEIMSLSDRVIVMHKGKISGAIDPTRRGYDACRTSDGGYRRKGGSGTMSTKK